MPTRLRAFIIAVVVITASLLGWQVRLFPSVDPQTMALVGAVATVAFVAELLVYQLPFAASGSFASMPLLSALLLSPTWMSTVAAGLSVAAVQILRRREWRKGIFNTAQAMASVALGGIVCHAAGWTQLPDTLNAIVASAQRTILMACGPAIIMTLSNTLMVSGVVAVATGQPWLRVWQRNTMGTLAYLLFTVPLAWILAGAAAALGVGGVLLVSLPLLALRQLEKSKREMERVNDELLELLVKTIEARDPYTSGHSQRVAQSVALLAETLRLPFKHQQMARTAALLHDVGKATIGDVLAKPGRLSNEERALMETHPVRGADIVKTLSHLKPLVAPILHHHEKWDGTGYPDRLAGEDIPIVARLITLADTIDAMATSRPYRHAVEPDEIYREIVKNRGTHFDARLADVVLHPVIWQRLWATTYQRSVVAPAVAGYRSLAKADMEQTDPLTTTKRWAIPGTPWAGVAAIQSGVPVSVASTMASDLATTIAEVRGTSGSAFPVLSADIFPLPDSRAQAKRSEARRPTPEHSVDSARLTADPSGEKQSAA